MYTRVRVKTFNILISVHFTVETKLGEVMSLNFSYIQNWRNDAITDSCLRQILLR